MSRKDLFIYGEVAKGIGAFLLLFNQSHDSRQFNKNKKIKSKKKNRGLKKCQM